MNLNKLRRRWAWTAALGFCLALPAAAQTVGDAERGATLYLQAPMNLASCVSCHGPDPAASRNNLLRAAGQPQVLLRTLNSIGAMGYLRDALTETDIADLAAYLGRVQAAISGPLDVWPRTLEVGTLALGGSSPEQVLRLRNGGTAALTLPTPMLAPALGDSFTLTHDCPAALPAGATCTARLRALGLRFGVATSALRLGPGGAVVLGTSVHVRDSREGPFGVLAWEGATADRLDFGAVPVGQSVTRVLSLRNTGGAALSLGVSTLTGPGTGSFVVGGDCQLATVLAPGQSCTTTLRFAPGAAAPAEALLQWRADATHPPSLRLDGAGVAVPPPVAGIGDGGGTGAGTGSGGGCAAAPAGLRAADKVDPSLPLLAALALTVLALRRRRGQQRS